MENLDSPDRSLIECVLLDLDELARRGLVMLSEDGGLALTDKGSELAGRAEAWVWS
jgi:hypothetical protein